VAITPVDRARLTKAFETFGPERVARGLGSTGHTWDDCFLARAAAGELDGFAPGLKQHCGMQRIAALEPGLEPEVNRLWDRDEVAFRALATEWLEDHPAVLMTSLSARRRTPPGRSDYAERVA
jgi:hypothetical protein